ncbi:Peptidoglycan D,D-transpeptidase FtsI [BD1-7 clade bacterium]|uniref:Peptidoglycan D,D-transpeptidase FtsI n=1 Tax=BD1-7 clade bacterium TaxID=2029982 RepID=A0A5S9N2X9_9GAMM|nr:Peptidoglycan D,D-transpeptidase FtsI [BD1-7 clade bacterium]
MMASFKRWLSAEWRFVLVAVGLLLLAMSLVGRMLMLQVLDITHGVDFLKRQGDSRTVRVEKIPGPRGMLTDRNGVPLAISTPVVDIIADPAHLVFTDDELQQLAFLLEMPAADIQSKLERYQAKRYMLIKREVSPIIADAVAELRIKGISGEEKYRRFYPGGEVTSHLVGYVDRKGRGQEGFENTYNTALQGDDGRRVLLKDLHDRTIKVLRQPKDPEPGDDIALSVDMRLQYLAYRELKTAVAKHRADAGSVVVLDIHTGEVLAMANQPAFNPNDRSRMNIASVRNRAVTDVFEPGSTVKPLAVLAALEAGKFSPDSKIDTNPGYVRVGRKTLLDPVNYGLIDVTKVITKSSQVGMTKIALTLEPEVVPSMLRRLGFAQPIDSGIPGESTGYFPYRERWRKIEQASLSFGHGVSVTAAQLARAYATVAARGEIRPVSFVKLSEPSKGEQVVAPALADQVIGMAKTVVGPTGTARKAASDLYSAAGKTGTTHKVGAKGYEAGKYISIFAGFAPADNPQIAVVVVVDDPKGREYYGGEVAAPVFSAIIEDGLRLLNVAPDMLSPESSESRLVSRGM